MRHRAIPATAMGACLLAASALGMTGCGGDGQPPRGSISAPRKEGASGALIEDKAKTKAAARGNVPGRAH
jgi:hypothetical protein